MQYGIPSHKLKYYGPQFASKCFITQSLFLQIKELKTAAYYPQTNREARLHSRSIFAKLRHYVSEYQRDWDKYLQPLTWVYNIRTPKVTGTSLTNIILQRVSPSDATFGRLTGNASNIPEHPESLQSNQRLLEPEELMKAAVASPMAVTQKRYKTTMKRSLHGDHSDLLVMKSISTAPHMPHLNLILPKILLRKCITNACYVRVDSF